MSAVWPVGQFPGTDRLPGGQRELTTRCLDSWGLGDPHPPLLTAVPDPVIGADEAPTPQPEIEPLGEPITDDWDTLDADQGDDFPEWNG